MIGCVIRPIDDTESMDGVYPFNILASFASFPQKRTGFIGEIFLVITFNVNMLRADKQAGEYMLFRYG